MRRCVTACLLILAGAAAAAEPATQPSSVIDLPAVDPVADFRLGALGIGVASAVRVYGQRSPRYNVDGAFPATLETFDLTKAKTTLATAVKDAAVRGMLQSGPRTLVWGDRPNLPTGNRLSNVPYLAVWNANGAEEVRFDDKEDFVVRAAALSADGGRALTASDNWPLRLWDARTGQLVKLVETGKNINCVALFADGRRAVLGGGWGDENVYVWDLELNRQLAVCVGHHGVVTSVAVSPDQRFVLSCSLDGSTRLWEAATGVELRRLRPMGVPVFGAIFSPDGRRVLTTLAERPAYGQLYMQVKPGTELRLWDLVTGRVIYEYESRGAPAIDAAFSPDGGSVTGLTAKHLFTWVAPAKSIGDAPPARPATAPASQPDPLTMPLLPLERDGQLVALGDDAVGLVGFLPDGQAYAVSDRSRIAHWDISHNLRRGTYAPAKVLQWPNVVGVSGDGRYAVSLQSPPNNEAFVWELTSGLITAHVVTKTRVQCAALSPDGTLVALGMDDTGAGRHVDFYRTTAGIFAGSINALEYSTASIVFAPDGNRIALAGRDDKTAAGEFDLDSGKLVANYVGQIGDLPHRLAYPADGRRLMGFSPRGATVWNTSGGARLQHWTMTIGITAAALSPDGRRLVTGGADTNVRVYDVATGKPITRFDHPLYPVQSLAVSPDGTRVLCGANDRALRVFELPK